MSVTTNRLNGHAPKTAAPLRLTATEAAIAAEASPPQEKLPHNNTVFTFTAGPEHVTFQTGAESTVETAIAEAVEDCMQWQEIWPDGRHKDVVVWYNHEVVAVVRRKGGGSEVTRFHVESGAPEPSKSDKVDLYTAAAEYVIADREVEVRDNECRCEEEKYDEVPENERDDARIKIMWKCKAAAVDVRGAARLRLIKLMLAYWGVDDLAGGPRGMRIGSRIVWLQGYWNDGELEVYPSTLEVTVVQTRDVTEL